MSRCCQPVYSGCCTNRLVADRCEDVAILQLVLSDENDSALVDDENRGFSLGLRREGSNVEFEFNREEAP